MRLEVENLLQGYCQSQVLLRIVGIERLVDVSWLEIQEVGELWLAEAVLLKNVELYAFARKECVFVKEVEERGK